MKLGILPPSFGHHPKAHKCGKAGESLEGKVVSLSWNFFARRILFQLVLRSLDRQLSELNLISISQLTIYHPYSFL